nr:GNAT family N-acetyltransferase [Auraticoccus cholistanensis]
MAWAQPRAGAGRRGVNPVAGDRRGEQDGPVPTEIRELTADDLRAAHALSHEAFGPPRLADDAEPGPYPPGRRIVGAFADGRLVAKLSGIDHRAWWHGAELASLGIGGVTVAVEHRGAGLLARLFEDALGAAREAGAAVSTLYPTAPAIYRGQGYEVVTDLLTVAVPTRALATLRVPEGVRLRRAEPADVPAVREVYRRWASVHNGPLTRTGPAFPAGDAELLAEPSGITLAERDGELLGYCSFERGTGYGPEAKVEVPDLMASGPEGYLALLASLGSHSSVVGRIEIRTSGDDLVRLLARTSDWQVVDRHPYMLAVLDVAAACTGRRWPPVRATVGWTVADAAGGRGWTLELDGEGGASCTPGPRREDVPTFSRRGFAARYSGHWSCASLRGAGLLTGPTGSDALLDAVFTGECHVRDYF